MTGKKTRRLLGWMLFTIMAVACVYFINDKAQAANYSAAYDKKVIGDLITTNKFTNSNTNVSMKEDETAKGVMISGKGSDMANCVFTFQDEFNFDLNDPSWLLIDGLSEKRKDLSLQFYLDNSTESFATVKLERQKKEYQWTIQNTASYVLSTDKLKGKHLISFRVLAGDEKNVTFMLRSIEFVKNDLPVVQLNIDESKGMIDAMNNDSTHDTECYGNMTLQVPTGYHSEYSNQQFTTQTYEMEYVRGRGNSTWGAPKKPYKIKLDKKADLLGMGKSKHWVLLANYYDMSMLRNKITYWLGAQLGMEYTPQCVFVDLVMNNKYLGSYYLCEQVRVDESRVDIDDLEKNDDTKAATDEPTITGGYLLGMQPMGDDGLATFSTTRGSNFEIESPSFQGYTNKAQIDYITNYVQKTEDAIYGVGFKDKDGIPYSDYMDVDAAIDYYWIQEISMNSDAFMSPSTYLYKKRNGKLYWGPLWDFDFVAWGAIEFSGNNVEGFTQNQRTWFAQLLQDDAFYKKAIARWSAIKAKLLEASKGNGQIDLYGTELALSQKYNYDLWTPFDGYMELGKTTKVTYESEVQRLKSWVNQRVNWIDNNLKKLRTAMHKVAFEANGKIYSTVYCPENANLEKMPKDPVKKGYKFKGWYAKKKLDGKEYEYEVSMRTQVVSDMTVYAKWVKLSDLIKAKNIHFAQQDIYVGRYTMLNLKVVTKPFNAYVGTLTWTTSNMDIVNVMDNMVFAGGKEGTAVLTVKSSNGLTAKCRVHVMALELGNIEKFTCQKKVTLKLGQYGVISIKTSPAKANPGTFIFGSMDSSIVAVNEIGELYAKKAGTTTVCIYNQESNSMKFCTVTVKKKR